MSEVVQDVAVDDKAAAELAKKEERRLKKASTVKVGKWRGLLADCDKRTRTVTFLLLVVNMIALSFTQLGFSGIGLPGEYVAYAITILAPMALAALLFGMPLGTLAGLIAGVIVFVHAQVQPLDFYEMNFVNPASSVLLFSFIGVVMSFLLALALRKDPPLWRRFVYILIVCTVISVLVSILFSLFILLRLTIIYAQLSENLGVDLSSDEILAQVFSSFSQLGSIEIQCFVDIALMVVVCYAAYAIVLRERSSRGNRSLRTTFRLWLFAAIGFVFVITAGLSFVIITEQSEEQAQKSMESEANYLISQLNAYEKRMEGVYGFIERDSESTQSLDDQEKANLLQLMSLDDILDGYTTEEDGTILIFKDDTVILSNDEAFDVGISDRDILKSGMITLHNVSLDSLPDGIVQVSFDPDAQVAWKDVTQDGELQTHETEQILERSITTRVAYMYSADSGDYSVVIVKPESMVFAGRTSVMAWTSLLALALLVTVYLLTSRLLTLVVVRRIDETNDVLARITDGNLDARVDIRDSREFKSLSSGINTTVGALKSWIAEAETRMDQELATAKAIQESALPRIFPPFPDIQGFDIYASMHPAREVGGDFYDFFLIGDDIDTYAGKLGFVVADVSGKGVPAALFMMAAKTEVRNYLESGMDPGEAIENANRQLCDGNDAGMFVTLFAGVLDYGTGVVRYVNAGHNPPLLWQGGSWRWLRDVSGMPLGLFDGFPYETYEATLSIGDEFFIYTDGVTEAMNPQGELFGEGRLEALANDNFTLHPRRLVETVRRELVHYANGAEQSDDITMLSLEYGVPPEVTATLIVKADVNELPNVNDFIHTELDRRLCPLKVQKQLDIALEELFVNVAHYAYPNATPQNPGRARISYTYSADPPSVTVEIADKGVPYNPLAKPDAVTPDDIMEVPIGGLGILMAKNSVDEMTYQYLDGYNIVSFKKKW